MDSLNILIYEKTWVICSQMVIVSLCFAKWYYEKVKTKLLTILWIEYFAFYLYMYGYIYTVVYDQLFVLYVYKKLSLLTINNITNLLTISRENNEFFLLMWMKKYFLFHLLKLICWQDWKTNYTVFPLSIPK